MLISRQKRFIFVHIYKNAGTSITTALLPFAASRWQRAANRFLKPLKISRFDPQPYPTHVKASELVTAMGAATFTSYFSFAVVRNPWDWQVSFYEYMLKNVSHRQHGFVKSLGSFEAYIHWLCAEEVRLQKDFVCSESGKLLVDFVARHETLERDFQSIALRIGISASLPRLNASNTTPYQQYYNSDTKDLVRKTFAADVSLFEYDF